jgi:hypothetical protein
MNAQNGTTGETGKPTAAEHAWLDAIRQRRNVRQLTDRLVPGDDLDQILKADRTFPTSQNSQQSTDPSTSTSWSSGSHPKTGRSSRRSAQATQPGGQAAHRSQGLPTLASHRVVRRGLTRGPASAHTSKACRTAPGWFSADRRSGSSPSRSRRLDCGTPPAPRGPARPLSTPSSRRSPCRSRIRAWS